MFGCPRANRKLNDVCDNKSTCRCPKTRSDEMQSVSTEQGATATDRGRTRSREQLPCLRVAASVCASLPCRHSCGVNRVCVHPLGGSLLSLQPLPPAHARLPVPCAHTSALKHHTSHHPPRPSSSVSSTVGDSFRQRSGSGRVKTQERVNPDRKINKIKIQRRYQKVIVWPSGLRRAVQVRIFF